MRKIYESRGIITFSSIVSFEIIPWGGYFEKSKLMPSHFVRIINSRCYLVSAKENLNPLVQ